MVIGSQTCRKEKGNRFCTVCMCGIRKYAVFVKGSYTAEAAAVFPLVLFSIVFLWYLGFFQHNRVVCQAICQEAVYAGLEAKYNGHDAESKVRQVLKEQSGVLFGTDRAEFEVSVSEQKIYAKIEAEMHLPFPVWRGTKAGDVWMITEEAELSVKHPVQLIREFRKAEKIKDRKDGAQDDGGI